MAVDGPERKSFRDELPPTLRRRQAPDSGLHSSTEELASKHVVPPDEKWDVNEKPPAKRGSCREVWAPVLGGCAFVACVSAVREEGKWVSVDATREGEVCFVHTMTTAGQTTCCPGAWDPCQAYFDELSSVIMALPVAIVLPLLEPVLSTLLSLCTGHSVWAPLRRLKTTALLIALCTAIIMAKDYAFDELFPETSDCWYASKRQSQKCADQLDLSAEVFRCLLQFLAPLGLTLAAIRGASAVGRVLRVAWAAVGVAACTAICGVSALHYNPLEDNIVAIVAAIAVLLVLARVGYFGAAAAGL